MRGPAREGDGEGEGEGKGDDSGSFDKQDALTQLEYEVERMTTMPRPVLKVGSRHRTWYGLAGRHKYCVAKPGSLPLGESTPTRFYPAELLSRSAPHLFPDLAAAYYSQPSAAQQARSRNRTGEARKLHEFVPTTVPRCLTQPRYMQVNEEELVDGQAFGGLGGESATLVEHDTSAAAGSDVPAAAMS